jgi:nucleolar protein 58
MMQVEARLRQLEGKGEEGVQTKGLPTPAKYTPGDGATTPKAYNTDADAVDKKAKKEKKRKADDETPGESAKKKKSKKEKKEKKEKKSKD